MEDTIIEDAKFAELLRARNTLHQALERSRSLEDDLAKTGPRLQRIAKRIPSLEAAFAPLRTHRKVLDGLGEDIDKAVEPAFAVLKVFEAMHDLERSLLADPQHDVVGYLGLISHLEQASSFLSANCSMAIEWLQEMVDFLQRNQVLKEGHMARIASYLEALKGWQATGDQEKLDGGLQDAALDRLEIEFQRVLMKESLPVLPASGALPKKTEATRRFLPAQTLKCLQLIVQKLVSNGRLQKCLDIFTETRSRRARASLECLQLDYLQLGSAEKRSKLEWKTLETYIIPWTQHMEVVVKMLLEPEFLLCGQLFEKIDHEGCEKCFVDIATSVGMLEFLQFGEAATKSKDEPQKLFKLLDMFEALNNLRPNFGKIFGGAGCKDVQQRTKDLLKQIVQKAHDIFLELKQQLQKQKEICPPIDGSVPKVSAFVLSYLKHLAGEFYGPIIAQVLAIHDSWSEEATLVKKTEESLLSKAVLSIMKALLSNINHWAKSVEEKEPALFHLFLCNNYWYLAMNCRVPELKSLVGDSWLKEQQQQAELHASLYVKEGWARITQHLTLPGVTTLTGSLAAAKDLIKTRLKTFNAAYEGLYQRHSTWMVPDAEMRERLCVKVVKTIVPAYKTYLQSYGPLMDQDTSRNKYVKYSAQSMELMLGFLYQGRPEKVTSGSDKLISGSTAIARPAAVVRVV